MNFDKHPVSAACEEPIGRTTTPNTIKDIACSQLCRSMCRCSCVEGALPSSSSMAAALNAAFRQMGCNFWIVNGTLYCSISKGFSHGTAGASAEYGSMSRARQMSDRDRDGESQSPTGARAYVETRNL